MDFILLIRPLLNPDRLHEVRVRCVAAVRMRLGLAWLLESARITDAYFHVPGLAYEHFGIFFAIPPAELVWTPSSEQWWHDHKNLTHRVIRDRSTN